MKEEVSERQKEMEVISKELIDEKCEVEEMSSKIAPSLVAAKETLRHLDQEDISEIWQVLRIALLLPSLIWINVGENSHPRQEYHHCILEGFGSFSQIFHFN